MRRLGWGGSETSHRLSKKARAECAEFGGSAASKASPRKSLCRTRETTRLHCKQENVY